MEENELAKKLLLGMSCKTCKYNGLYSSINYMKLPECHYWFLTDRKHKLALDPPNLSSDDWCKKWEKHD